MINKDQNNKRKCTYQQSVSKLPDNINTMWHGGDNVPGFLNPMSLRIQ